ncbi:MAG: hypothetical protein MJ237_00010 [bacterium]|nr:hypothetical protein [bacterium]
MNNKEQLQKRIHQTELQLKRLTQNCSGSTICEDLYNSLILQKAILKKQLDDLNKNPVIENIKKLIPRQKKLICDYFE